jgi:hypothetical protein
MNIIKEKKDYVCYEQSIQTASKNTIADNNPKIKKDF